MDVNTPVRTSALDKDGMNHILFKFILLQITFYSANGGFMPFRVVFLSDRGLSGSLIGIILTVYAVIAILMQPLWGMLGDRLKSVKKVFTICLVMCMILVPALTLANSFIGYLVIMSLLAVFICPFFALLDTWTIQGLKSIPGHRSYGSIRMWGSIGFSITVIFLGRIADAYSINSVFYLYTLMNIVTLIVIYTIPIEGASPEVESNPEAEYGQEQKKKGLQIGRLIKNYYYITFVICICFINTSSSIKMSYLPLRMEYAGGNTQLFSMAMSIGAFAEVPMFFLSYRILKRFKPLMLIITSIFLSLFHMFILSFDISATTILIIHIIQGLSYGLIVTGNVYYVDSLAPSNLKASAQTIFSAAYMGVSGVLGTSIGGLLIDRIGILRTFRVGFVFSMIAFVIFLATLTIGRIKNITYQDNTGQ